MNGTYHNPLGIQDHMPLETQHKSEIQDRMRRLFARRGYRLRSLPIPSAPSRRRICLPSPTGTGGFWCCARR